MTGHAVVIAGGGPTGLMLAGELALAGVDVAIVERRTSQDARGPARRRPARPHHRGARPAWDRRPVPVGGDGGAGRGLRRNPAGHQRLSHATPVRPRAVADPHRAVAGGVGRRARRAVPSRARRDGVRAGRCRRRRRARRRALAACGVSRRVRRRAQRGPQGSRHRVPRVGADDELPDRRGRAGRGAGMGHAQGRHRHPWLQPAGGRAGAGHGDRAAPRSGRRGHPARPQRGARGGVGDRLRRAQPHVDLAVHRHGPAGRGLPRPAGPAGRRRGPRAQPGGRPGTQRRRAGRGEPGLEARPGGRADVAGQPPGHVPRGAPPDRGPRPARHDRPGLAVPRRRAHPDADRHVRGAPRDGRAAAAVRRPDVRPGRPLRPRRGPPAARAPHARSRPGCRRRPAAGVHPAARRPAGAARPRHARRPRHRAVVGSRPRSSTPSTSASGSCRCSARSRLPPPC